MRIPARAPALGSLVAVALAAVVATSGRQTRAAGQQNDAPPLETIHVAGNVYMLQTPTAGGNLGVLTGPDGVLLVDAQFAPQRANIVAAVDAIADTGIRYL